MNKFIQASFQLLQGNDHRLGEGMGEVGGYPARRDILRRPGMGEENVTAETSPTRHIAPSCLKLSFANRRD